MAKSMLIDASHPEETRVAVAENNQLNEFDFESRAKAALRGNIYLAKVIRVEPSLQAAFVDYGGNRHGFLAFSEIHPDYYQIPVADREALLKEYAAEEAEHAANDEASDEASAPASDGAETQENGENEGETVEQLNPNAQEETARPVNKRALYHKYKIQEVIKRRQIILVQVLKEERGTKGAALTTYLSLAGRYCVLMPNTARGGGISRKIPNGADRKKLKTIVSKLEVPNGMGLIVRTAGAQRTLTEIRRDWQYLSRLWEEVRDKTMDSTAPCLVYEESDIIRRCIRDVYSKDFEEIIISGEEAYKEARNYMKLLMPSHARKVKQHTHPEPIFKKHGVEDKLAAMFNPVVALPSGGYLVINPTEALVAVDVNSGRATREYSVEKTALNTNLEAAVEVARQARLRDLAGLLVIDFIDMEERANNRAVEKRLKEALKNDRARLRVGHISNFGLLEMSRQRMRSGVLEGSSETCPHCNGAGMVRSVESRALHVLRHIEEELDKYESGTLSVHVPEDVASYLLNHKRQQLSETETRRNVTIMVLTDNKLTAMEMSFTLPDQVGSSASTRMEGNPTAALDSEQKSEQAQRHAQPRRQRRRRGGRGRNRNGEETRNDETAQSGAQATATTNTQPNKNSPEEATETASDKPKRRRRRGRRPNQASEQNQQHSDTKNGDEPGLTSAPVDVVSKTPDVKPAMDAPETAEK